MWDQAVAVAVADQAIAAAAVELAGGGPFRQRRRSRRRFIIGSQPWGRPRLAMRDGQLLLAQGPATCEEAREPIRTSNRRFQVIFVSHGFQRADVFQQLIRLPAMCLIDMCFMMLLAK